MNILVFVINREGCCMLRAAFVGLSCAVTSMRTCAEII
jgi:hypothetical protein